MESEADLARVVVAEMQRWGYETYQEVSLRHGKRADIVGVRGRTLSVVETKTSLSLSLLDQLTEWQGRAHYIVGAVPARRFGPAALRYLSDRGFGLWSVAGTEIKERQTPRLFRRIDETHLRAVLVEEQRSGQYAEAGSRAGGYFTPFRGTIEAFTEYARQHPGVPLRQAVREVKHHYASSRSALASIPDLIRRGVITCLRVEGKPLCLYTGQSPEAPRLQRG